MIRLTNVFKFAPIHRFFRDRFSTTTSQMTKVVILGGSFGGCYALKQLRGLSKDLELTLISPSDQIWFNVAAPRLLVEPHRINDSLFPLANYVQKYNATFIHGKATHVDFEANSVAYEGATSGTVDYDFLVVATGTQNDKMFKTNENAQIAIDAIKEAVGKLESAKTVGIIGGGPTGVESAGEIARELKKDVTLYTGGKEPLEGANLPSVTGKLEKLGVKIINNVRSTEIRQVGDAFEVDFDNGTSAQFDYVIGSIFCRPYTDFLPASATDEHGYVKTNKQLVVEGTQNVLAIGDVVSGGLRTIVDIKLGMLPVLEATAKRLILNAGTGTKEWKPVHHTIVVPVSRDGGAGRIFGWSVPSFVIWLLKSRTFMLDSAKGDFT